MGAQVTDLPMQGKAIGIKVGIGMERVMARGLVVERGMVSLATMAHGLVVGRGYGTGASWWSCTSLLEELRSESCCRQMTEPKRCSNKWQTCGLKLFAYAL